MVSVFVVTRTILSDHITHITGLDCRGTTGTSFSAHLKNDLKEDSDFWHCLCCHVFNLALNDTLEAIESIKLFYVPHLRMMHSEFKRSSTNRATLKSVHDDLQEFDRTWNWKIFYPQLFCLTRWLGLHKCADILSRKSNRVMMKKYAEKLRDNNFGPRKFDPYKYRRRRRQRDAEDAGGDNCDGDDIDSSEEEELSQIQTAIEEGRVDADGYQPQPQLFSSAEEAAASAPSQDECVRADDFDEGRVDATGRKCKNMLNKNVGITDLNCGRSAYLSGLLTPYQILMKQLQRTEQPEQHLAARRLRQFYMVMQTAWIGSKDAEPVYSSQHFREWSDEMIALGKTDLVDLVKKECRAFASVFVASVKERLASTWNHIQSLELVDPMGPDTARYATPPVWDALEDLCNRRSVNFDRCKHQILTMRAEAENLSASSKVMIRTDLCGYLRDRHSVFVQTHTESTTPDYDLMCKAIFSIPLVASFVESLFSKMSYNQHKIRNGLKDSSMSSILHVHDAVLPDPQSHLQEGIKLKAMTPQMLNDKCQMSKMLGVTVCDEFDGNRFHGEVTEVLFHDLHAQYMYHVVYEDGDECDYWRHEVEMIRCRCRHIDT